MIWIRLTVVCVLLAWGIATCAASEAPEATRKTEPVDSATQAILRETTQLILIQDEGEHYWYDSVLLDIGEVQIRAGDFEDALKSIRSCSDPYRRDVALIELAEALARGGTRKGAFEILRLLSDHGSREDEDRVHLRWIEQLIESRDLDRACKAVEELKCGSYRSKALRMLAVGYARSGDGALAAQQFALAIDTATALKDECDRARGFWETAEAQLSAGGIDAAKATILRLVETVQLRDPWTKITALSQCAILAALANDRGMARRLFRRALEAQRTLDDARQKNAALNRIAVAQAAVGYIDEARNTSSMIKHNEGDFTQDAEREQALFAIAQTQLKANDIDGALRTALSVQYYLQYRDDALQEIVDYQIAGRDLKRALAIAEKMDNPSRKAAAMLKVATAHAKSGGRRRAAEVAARIELTDRGGDLLPQIFQKQRFDYRLPRTWGVPYDEGFSFTIGSYLISVKRAQEVAGAAMALAQALGQQPAQSYAILFDDIQGEITGALARAHAACGQTREALAWAR
jgi:hypothetical protein